MYPGADSSLWACAGPPIECVWVVGRCGSHFIGTLVHLYLRVLKPRDIWGTGYRESGNLWPESLWDLGTPVLDRHPASQMLRRNSCHLDALQTWPCFQ